MVRSVARTGKRENDMTLTIVLGTSQGTSSIFGPIKFEMQKRHFFKYTVYISDTESSLSSVAVIFFSSLQCSAMKVQT